MRTHLEQLLAYARQKATPILVGLLALVSVVTVTVVLTDDDQDGVPEKITITVKAPAGERTIEIPREALLQAARTDVGDHEQLRSEQPVGVTREQLEAGQEQQDRLAETDALPIVTPLAAPEQAGCITRLVANKSSRRGVRPRLFVVHYTVSPNRPGWSDVLSIVGLFDRPSFSASSHYVIDAEGHCAYIVRESDKAWTQAAANPVAISAEMINSGREGSLAGTAGLAKLARVIADAGRRWQIPMQQGAVSGCTVTRPGIVTHQMLGPCGGGHVDISPYELAPVIAAAKRASAQGAGGRTTAVDRRTCRKLNWWRRAGRPHGLPERRAVRRRVALRSRGVVCYRRGPVKR